MDGRDGQEWNGAMLMKMAAGAGGGGRGGGGHKTVAL